MLEMTLIIHGRVQGVGYRYSICREIDNEHLQIKGFIQNMPNGTVQIVGQGDIEALKTLRKLALEGSERSSVRDIEEVIENITEYTYDTFEIRY